MSFENFKGDFVPLIRFQTQRIHDQHGFVLPEALRDETGNRDFIIVKTGLLIADKALHFMAIADPTRGFGAKMAAAQGDLLPSSTLDERNRLVIPGLVYYDSDLSFLQNPCGEKAAISMIPDGGVSAIVGRENDIVAAQHDFFGRFLQKY